MGIVQTSVVENVIGNWLPYTETRDPDDVNDTSQDPNWQVRSGSGRVYLRTTSSAIETEVEFPGGFQRSTTVGPYGTTNAWQMDMCNKNTFRMQQTQKQIATPPSGGYANLGDETSTSYFSIGNRGPAYSTLQYTYFMAYVEQSYNTVTETQTTKVSFERQNYYPANSQLQPTYTGGNVIIANAPSTLDIDCIFTLEPVAPTHTDSSLITATNPSGWINRWSIACDLTVDGNAVTSLADGEFNQRVGNVGYYGVAENIVACQAWRSDSKSKDGIVYGVSDQQFDHYNV